MIKRIIFILIFAFLFAGCDEEPVETVFFDLDTTNGAFIACEGNFMYGNASLSFYNISTEKVTNQLFYARNNAPLGDVAQSLALFDDVLFIVVNNSGKIVAIDPETAEFRGTITGLTSPRNIHFISEEKAYISDLYANYITIFNPQTFEITGEIDLGEHTSEQMIQSGNYVFVTSWMNDNFVLVVDIETDKMVTKIEVPFQPKDLEKDKNGKIWVLSEGSYEITDDTELAPALSRIDPLTFTIEQIYRFPGGLRPSSLEINAAGDTVYYLNNGVQKMSIRSAGLPDSTFISQDEKLFYHLAVHPQTNELFVADAIDYAQDAIVYRFSHDAGLMDSFRVGINPSDFLFK